MIIIEAFYYPQQEFFADLVVPLSAQTKSQVSKFTFFGVVGCHSILYPFIKPGLPAICGKHFEIIQMRELEKHY